MVVYGSMRRWLSLSCIALTAMTLPVQAPAPLFSPLIGSTPAFADDDGGDDGGGGRGGGRGGRGGRGDRADGAGRDGGGERATRPWRGGRGNLFRGSFWSGQPRRQAQRRPAAVARAPDYRRDEIIAFGLDDQQIATLQNSGFAVRSRRAVPSLGTEVVKLDPPNGQSLNAARARVREIAPTASVDFNHIYRPSSATACGGKPCVAPTLVGWPARDTLSARCIAGEITIGLIDTAVNAGHETFRSSRIEVLKLEETSPAGESGEEHGTAIASLLVGTGQFGTPGLLPQARLVAVDAFRRDNRADAYDLVVALDLLLERPVSVINLSLAGPDNVLLARTVSAVAERGISMVAAAGNHGPSAKPGFPAGYPEVIAVTAVDRRKQAYRRANRGDHIDIAAPGVGVWVAASSKGARQQSGTSFAAPFVTAAVAVARAQAQDLGAVEELLLQSAEDLGKPGKDPVFGWGLLDGSALCVETASQE